MATVTNAAVFTTTNNVTSYVTGAFTPTANSLLIVFVTKSGSVNNGTITDSLGGSPGWSTITAAAKSTSLDRMVAFVRKGVVPAQSMTVTYDCTGSAATGCILQVAQVTGMAKAGADAVRQSGIAQNQASGAIPSAAFGAACLTANAVLGCVGNSTNPATETAPATWTEGTDTGYITPTTGAEYAWVNSGFTGTTVTWGTTSASTYGVIVLELNTLDTTELAGRRMMTMT